MLSVSLRTDDQQATINKESRNAGQSAASYLRLTSDDDLANLITVDRLQNILCRNTVWLGDINQHATLTNISALLEECRKQVFCQCRLVFTQRLGQLHNLVNRQRVRHVTNLVKAELDTCLFTFQHQVLEYRIHVRGTAKTAREVNIERPPALGNVRIQLIWVPADVAGSLDGFPMRHQSGVFRMKLNGHTRSAITSTCKDAVGLTRSLLRTMLESVSLMARCSS